ncbi:MAG: nucleotide exchange factor GrpE [Thermoplasmata archaeon]|jgi:molecular chaperone GrpE
MSDPAPEPPSAAPGPAPAEAEPDWATRYKYLLADFENFRRRSERERESTSRQVRAALIRELLPIYEGFHFAREALQRLPSDDPVRTGLDLLHREWQTFLKHEGVEPVASPGGPFESETQEAVGEAPADAEHPAGTVLQVVQQGFRFYGGLLRPAKVIVARSPDPVETAPAEPPAPEGSA